MPDVERSDTGLDAPGHCAEGSARIHELAAALLPGEGDPMRLANQIYGAATEYGAWYGRPGNIWADASCPELAEPGAEFLQVADALELHQDSLKVVLHMAN